ncbi:hypothetical protein [Glycomyces tritici]|uniref:DUF3137 domain-containing protein n=1 Tax=Glycomyces tritici TaxID=2665176 RepID=A0ABT7YMQ0_9ACTN|nr:hypothetical protein [Glycomyces tritici]MDN3239922.1 hypothetical protein [Glycomyces tritici]
MDSYVWIFALAGVVIAGATALRRFGPWSGGGERRQTSERHAFAQQHGLQYRYKDHYIGPPSLRTPFQDPVGSLGATWDGFHVMRGTYRGHHMLAYECRVKKAEWESYEAGFQVVAIALPTARPFLDIRPESDLSRALEKDLQFENHEFNQVFRVMSDNPRFAHDVLHARTMEWMLADGRARSIPWRFEGGWLMTFRRGGVNTAEVLPSADFLIDLLAQVPKHVWSAR